MELNILLMKNTGYSTISYEDKNNVKQLYERYVEFKKKTDKDFVEPKLGYYNVLTSDIPFSGRNTYTLDDNDN